MNGSPAGNGSASGIADFDQVAASIQQLFLSLDGPPQKLSEEHLPHLVAEQIAQTFPVDLSVILLKTDDGVRTMVARALVPRPCRPASSTRPPGTSRRGGDERAKARLPGRAAVADWHRPEGEGNVSLALVL